MASTRVLLLAAHAKLLSGEVPNRLQHGEAGIRRGVQAAQQALRDQRLQGVQQTRVDVLGVAVRCTRHGGPAVRGHHRVEPEPIGENRQLAKQALLLGVQEIVAPGDRRVQRLVTRRQVPRASGQQLQTLVQSPREVGRREHVDLSRGQLDRQGEAVEPAANVGDRPCVLTGDRERGLDRPGPLAKQPDRVVADHRRGDVVARWDHQLARWDRQGGHRPGFFPAHAQRLAARGQDREAGAALEEGFRERGAGVEEVLAVVQDEQHAARPNGAREYLMIRCVRPFRHAQTSV